MNLDKLMPQHKESSDNNRKTSREQIKHLILLLKDNGFTESTTKIKIENQKAMDKLDNTDLSENCMGLCYFYEKVTEFNWAITFDDDIPFVHLVIVLKNPDGQDRAKLLNIVNQVNYKLNTLISVSIDNDNDYHIEYNMPIGISDEIVLTLIKRIKKEIMFSLQYIRNDLT